MLATGSVLAVAVHSLEDPIPRKHRWTSHEEITAKRSTLLDLYMASASWFIMNYHASWLIWCLSIWPSIADFGPGRIHQSSLS